jgi:hypothetical protein
MAIDTTTPTSRRGLLAGTVGALAALAAHALGRPRPASAHDPDDVRLGGSNTATGVTTITNTALNGGAFSGLANGLGIGVYGSSPSGWGVFGVSNSGNGVYGQALNPNAHSIHGYKGNGGTAVWGEIQFAASTDGAVIGTTNGTGPGVFGFSDSGTGVLGTTASGVGVTGFSQGVGKTSIHGIKGNAGTAVFGEITYAASTDGAVVGSTNATGGPGVRGVNSANGRGLWGKAQGSGEGVYGESTNGVGGLFTGGKAQLKLTPKATAGKPTSGAHTKGEIYMDSKGALFVCTANGTPGTWRKVTTTAT